MASYKKYAEDLIGNWEKDIYAPQKDVTQAIYQTNWNKLSNQYNDVKDKLARNYDLARKKYTNTLNDIQNASFNRMQNANIDLANRGLSSSGIGNLVTQSDTQAKGEDIDRALSSLMQTNQANAEGLTQDVMKLGEGQTSLAGDLAGDIGKLTDADAANTQQYANLIAGISQSAAGRAASRARSGGGGSGRRTKKEKEDDELKRRILIADTLSSTDLTDQEKKDYLYKYLDVPAETAVAAVDGYNNNNLLSANQRKLDRLQTKSDNYANAAARWKAASDTSNIPIVRSLGNIFNVPNSVNQLFTKPAIERTQNNMSNLTYTDLYELLYGKK